MIRKFSTFLSLSILLLAGSYASNATVFNISANGNNSWSNPNVSCQRGDTIKWIWISGTHNTVSTSVPAGATTWNAPLDASHTSFSYVVNITGTYVYQCSFHPSTMQGAFLVSEKTSVGNLFTEAGITISPNPATSFIMIKSGMVNPTITLTNVIGKTIGTFTGVATTEGVRVDVANVPSGTYFVTLTSKEMVLTRRIVIAH